MTDKENLREIFADINRRNPFVRYNHIEVEEVERDRTVLSLTIRPESLNLYGQLHGGAIYTMADNAAGSAARTDGRRYVTQASDMHFLSNQTDGVVRAEARVRHRGRTTALIDISVTGKEGKLLASGTFTFFCVDKPSKTCESGGEELKNKA